ncbi:iron ABC transporter permease [Sphingobium sufflavum]|uniref:FecCD family ABC transporter permease n=1 Tax=Sphingobium sufflavum TaxID=1129547 RepID=UPI001F1CE17D|nr:iron ABC transporter permease [Sphingobium sufflavum]MCE7796184.1 iron ABC transporter permease [Sphingobium sufflavum]
MSLSGQGPDGLPGGLWGRLPNIRRGAAARRAATFAILGLLLVVVALYSTFHGVARIPVGTGVAALLSPLLPAGWRPDVPAASVAILTTLRLPRTLLALIAGAGLAVAGAAMQGITRNPLVSPYTIGISPAASFGASVAILMAADHGMASYAPVVVAAFLAALACAAFVLGLSALRGVTGTVLVLAGVGLSYLFGALAATLQFIATEQQLAVIVHWAFGSVNGATWPAVQVTGVVLAIVLPVLAAHAWALNAFAAGGDEVASSLGFAVARTRIVVTVCAVLITAAIVSYAGVIGFVGLVAPHIGRLMVGGDHRVLLPFSAMAGALLLLLADLTGRLLFAPVVVPAGIVVAYLGVPVFLHLLLGRTRGASS